MSSSTLGNIMPILKMILKECVLEILVNHHHGVNMACDSEIGRTVVWQTSLMGQTTGIVYT